MDITDIARALSYRMTPSRMRITRAGRIFLDDYNGREVKMDTLSKTVYFLYLRHPEGIRFKELADHRDELESIYAGLSGRGDVEGMRRSIDDLVSPLSNSINEKVSKVKKAIRDVVDERVARHYYIDGAKGEARRVPLSRDMLVWE